VWGTGGELMARSGACARGRNRWMSRATRPLPLPVSPSIRMRGGRDARAHASRSLSTCPRTSTIAGLSPSSSAPSVTRALPLRSGLGAALRDRPRELADQPRIALLDDLEAVVGVPDRILAGSLFVPDLDDALVPVQEAPARGLERDARQLLLDPAILAELEFSVVAVDRALFDGCGDVQVGPVLAVVVRAAAHRAEQPGGARRRRRPGAGDFEPKRDSAVLEQSQPARVPDFRSLHGRELVGHAPHIADKLLVHWGGAVVPPEYPMSDAAVGVLVASHRVLPVLVEGTMPARTPGQLLLFLLAAFARRLDADERVHSLVRPEGGTAVIRRPDQDDRPGRFAPATRAKTLG